LTLIPKSETSSESGVAAGELALAAGVVVLGMFLLLGISKIPFGSGYDRIGPRFFPYAVAAGLLLLGGSLGIAAFRATDRTINIPESSSAPSPPLNWASLGTLGLGLLLCLALLDWAGFVIACSVQFWLVARAFHSQRPARDAIVAVLLSAIVYFAFSHLLGLTLPAGIFESLS
jgi:putative tricarboxylic transport membrane protein